MRPWVNFESPRATYILIGCTGCPVIRCKAKNKVVSTILWVKRIFVCTVLGRTLVLEEIILWKKHYTLLLTIILYFFLCKSRVKVRVWFDEENFIMQAKFFVLEFLKEVVL